MEEFDFVIIGAGPAGLTLSYTLSYLGYRVALIEKEKTIGGCHRVNRVDGLFAEHGPRVYSDAYVNMRGLLGHMGLDFYDLFSGYDPDKWSFFRLKPSELAVCALEYGKMLVYPDYGKNHSVEWLTKNFSQESKDFIDRLCRLTDGAGSDRYTVHQFLNLFNQNMLNGVYIPKEPNDVGLFRKWKLGDNTKLFLEKGVKEFKLENNKLASIVLNDGQTIRGKKFLVCIPPQSLIELIRNTPIQNAFGNYEDLINWSMITGYNSYIPIAFHWDSEITLPKKWGFPISDWGVAFIIMTRYMKFSDIRSKTVVSTCIMYSDRPSSYTGKTANQSTREELISEVFRQLQVALDMELPKYSFAVPNTIQKEGNKWYDTDKAFVVTPNGKFLGRKSPIIENLYSIGTHNGKSIYSFTTFESALTNALSALHELVPESRREFGIKSPLSLDTILRWIFMMVALSIVFLVVRKYKLVSY